MKNKVDFNFQEFCNISANVFRAASNKMLGKSVNLDINVEPTKNRLSELFNNIDEENKQKANRIYSETLLDLNYLDNSATNILSLRLGQIYSSVVGKLNK